MAGGIVTHVNKFRELHRTVTPFTPLFLCSTPTNSYYHPQCCRALLRAADIVFQRSKLHPVGGDDNHSANSWNRGTPNPCILIVKQDGFLHHHSVSTPILFPQRSSQEWPPVLQSLSPRACKILSQSLLHSASLYLDHPNPDDPFFQHPETIYICHPTHKIITIVTSGREISSDREMPTRAQRATNCDNMLKPHLAAEVCERL